MVRCVLCVSECVCVWWGGGGGVVWYQNPTVQGSSGWGDKLSLNPVSRSGRLRYRLPDGSRASRSTGRGP